MLAAPLKFLGPPEKLQRACSMFAGIGLAPGLIHQAHAVDFGVEYIGQQVVSGGTTFFEDLFSKTQPT